MTFREQEAKLNPLVSALGSCDDSKRLYALARVSRLDADNRVRLIEKLLAEYDRAVVWEPQRNVLLSVVAGLFGMFCLGIKPCFATAVLGIGVSMITVLWLQSRSAAKRLQRSLQALIADSADARLVPLCLDRRWLKNGEYDNSAKNRSQAMRALILKNSLPLLQSRDADTWTQMRKENLLSILNAPFRDVEVTLCTLGALEQIGQNSALKPVQFLAKMPLPYVMACMPQVPFDKLPTLTTGAERIKRAAARVLPAIEARAREEMNPRVLLRAVETPYSTPASELLRAVEANHPDVAANELLRPDAPDSEESAAALPARWRQEGEQEERQNSTLLNGNVRTSHSV